MKKIGFWVALLFCFQLGSAQNFDIRLLKQIHTSRNDNLDKTFNFITNSNDYVNIGSAGILTLTGYIKKDRELTRKGFFLISGQITTLFITQGLKRVIRRERPFLQYSFIKPYKLEDGFSMPSGHTSSAFANAMTLSYLYPKWYVIVPSFTYASLVGYSRLHLGVHYPTDVIAGAAVGIGSFYISKWVWNKLFLKKIVHKKI